MTSRHAAGASPAVLGIADHSGWAVCVTVTVRRGYPVVVDRRRVELAEPGVPTQPYHHQTVGMPLADAEKLVVRVRKSVLQTTLARVTELRDALQPSYVVVAMTLRTPPLPYVPVTVADAHTSYAVMCRADAMLYHGALCSAAQRLSLALEMCDRGEEVGLAANRLGVSVPKLEHFLEKAGEGLGPPWRKEHRLATAAAIGALLNHTRVSLSP